jgi:nucleotide-binding universal stress UspA family protein
LIQRDSPVKQIFKTIVCPVDLEAHSMAAVEMARRLAEQNEAKVVLVHSVTPPLPGPMEPSPGWENTAKSRLEKIAREHLADKVRGDAMVLRGEASAAIIRTARELGADLIVMTTHGRTGLNRVLLGSTAELVVRESPVPVLTVGPDRS